MRTIIKTARISPRGRLTIPKRIRDRLGTLYITLVFENGVVRVKPARAKQAGVPRRRSARKSKAYRRR